MKKMYAIFLLLACHSKEREKTSGEERKRDSNTSDAIQSWNVIINKLLRIYKYLVVSVYMFIIIITD